jgi:hypothetical protein
MLCDYYYIHRFLFTMHFCHLVYQLQGKSYYHRYWHISIYFSLLLIFYIHLCVQNEILLGLLLLAFRVESFQFKAFWGKKCVPVLLLMELLWFSVWHHRYLLLSFIAPLIHCSFDLNVYLLQDYHRFHLPVSGTIEQFVNIPGCLFTVCEIKLWENNILCRCVNYYHLQLFLMCSISLRSIPLL